MKVKLFRMKRRNPKKVFKKRTNVCDLNVAATEEGDTIDVKDATAVAFVEAVKMKCNVDIKCDEDKAECDTPASGKWTSYFHKCTRAWPIKLTYTSTNTVTGPIHA